MTGETGGETLLERIRAEIRERGPMRFDRFMELALYGPDGYYERPPVGLAGDFVTSPHVHPWFAYGLALAFGELHELLGSPSPATLVEVGAGEGKLARQLLEILNPGAALDYVAVERSAGARAALEGAGVRACAYVEDVGDLRDTVVIANELLDNLPFRRLRRSDGKVVEVRVGLDVDRLVEVEAAVDDAPPATGEHAELVVPTGALAFVDTLAARMRNAYALLIDYSAERGRDVHGYRAQRIVEDVVASAGATDVTAGVDFDAVEVRAIAAGLGVLGRVSQRDALLALGFDEWTRRDREARAGSDAAATRAWAARNRASLLLAPDGLGAHRWLLLATPGLPVPRWLRRALAPPSPD